MLSMILENRAEKSVSLCDKVKNELEPIIRALNIPFGVIKICRKLNDGRGGECGKAVTNHS